MEDKGHPIAGAIMFVIAVIPSFDGPLLSLIFSMILMILAFIYGFWGAIWRTLALCSLVLIPLVFASSTQLPGGGRADRYRAY